MKHEHSRSPVRNGLTDISVEQFWKNPLLLAEVLQEKRRGLPVDPKRFPRLADEIQVFQELLFAFGTQRYRTFSLLAFVDILQAVDHFLVLGDKNPDTTITGYSDDAEIVHRVFLKHADEIRVFKEWLRVQV
jgi:hypothetical protein